MELAGNATQDASGHNRTPRHSARANLQLLNFDHESIIATTQAARRLDATSVNKARALGECTMQACRRVLSDGRAG